MGLPASDVELVASAVRLHLLLPMIATRRDLDDPVTVKQVATTVRSRVLLELLHALAIADGLATGPAAWNDWKATLVADLVRRVEAVLDGEPMPQPAPLRDDQLALAAEGAPAATVRGSEVTVVAPDRPGLLWRAAGVLASHRLTVRSANATSVGGHGRHRLRRGTRVRRPARRHAGGCGPAPDAAGPAGCAGPARPPRACGPAAAPLRSPRPG